MTAQEARELTQKSITPEGIQERAERWLYSMCYHIQDAAQRGETETVLQCPARSSELKSSPVLQQAYDAAIEHLRLDGYTIGNRKHPSDPVLISW